MKLEKGNINLIKDLKNGSEGAFRSIFVAFFESLVVFARNYLMDEDLAKDIVQDVFANLWNKRNDLASELNLKAYLYQSTRNTCLNYIKRLKVQSKYEKRLKDNYQDLALNMEALSQLNLDQISYQELQAALDESINQLPVRCREVFELSRYEGLKNREIAEQLNISVKAVEGHISKALKQIKENLKAFYSSTISFFVMLAKK